MLRLPLSPAMHVGVMPNWVAGWTMLLLAFACGAGVGLSFHRDDFWGGYASFRRRLVRLGHIALAALGMLNLLFAVSPVQLHPVAAVAASWLLMIGGFTMPAVCFLTARFRAARHAFAIPVAALLSAAVAILLGSIP